MSVLIDVPFKVFFDTDGSVLENGYIYIGVAGLNPLTNPLTAYWDADLLIPAANIRTIHGFPSYRGSPGALYTSDNYSMLVRNSVGTTVYSSLNCANYLTDAKKIFGDYEVETQLIDGTTDKKLVITNKQTGKQFSMSETRSPDGATTEATHTLGCLASAIDWLFKTSLHNASGTMRGDFVLEVLNDDTKAEIYWILRRRPTGTSDYGVMEDYYMMRLSETNGLQVNAAASEGVAPTWINVLSAANLGTGWLTALGVTLGSNWSTAFDANLSANWITALAAAIDADWVASFASLNTGWQAAFAQQHKWRAVEFATGCIIAGASGIVSPASSSYVKIRTIQIDLGGSVTTRFGLACTDALSQVWAKIYINDVAVGTERTSSSASYAYYEQAFNINAGDLIQIYAKNTNNALPALVKDFTLCATNYNILVDPA